MTEEMLAFVNTTPTPTGKTREDAIMIESDTDEECEILKLIDELKTIIEVKPRRLFPGAIKKVRRTLKLK